MFQCHLEQEIYFLMINDAVAGHPLELLLTHIAIVVQIKYSKIFIIQYLHQNYLSPEGQVSFLLPVNPAQRIDLFKILQQMRVLDVENEVNFVNLESQIDCLKSFFKRFLY